MARYGTIRELSRQHGRTVGGGDHRASQEEKRERQIPFESEEETGDEDEVQYDSFGNTISP